MIKRLISHSSNLKDRLSKSKEKLNLRLKVMLKLNNTLVKSRNLKKQHQLADLINTQESLKWTILKSNIINLWILLSQPMKVLSLERQ